MIDWRLAKLLAGRISGAPLVQGPDSEQIRVLADQSAERVVEYTRLQPVTLLPPAEAVTRDEWVAANARSLGALIEPALAQVGERAGVAGHGVRLAAGAALTLEAGAVLGLLSRKVLGQYDLALVRREDDPPPRLLFVSSNLAEAKLAFGSDGDDFLHWVTIHEVNHAVQFSSVPWLRDYIGGLASELLGSLGDRGDGERRQVSDVARSAAGRATRSIATRDPMALVLDERDHATIVRMQAVMSVVEGHAEHVMDAVGAEVIPSVSRLRGSMSARRRSAGPLWRVLGKLLGIELKMKQYEEGRRFCDEVVRRAGIEGLNIAWSSPEALPEISEIGNAARWLDRVA
jgi:coenzyme F420 biosynthesis associated uncharacterized protein